MLDTIYEDISAGVAKAFVALDKTVTPAGPDVDGDYGRADGKWHREVGTSRMIYAVETPFRPALADESVRRAAEAHGFGLVLFDVCGKCRKTSALLPVYGVSGGYAGKSIFYLTAPATVFSKASE